MGNCLQLFKTLISHIKLAYSDQSVKRWQIFALIKTSANDIIFGVKKSHIPLTSVFLYTLQILIIRYMQLKFFSASGVFSGSPQSVIFDERSGCQVRKINIFYSNKFFYFQIDRSTVKVVVWFDNEHGYANRIIDLVRKCYDVYNQ